MGDYVNGYKVTFVSTGGELTSGRFVKIDSEMDSSNCTIFEEDIKTIVTKEQFSQTEYRIGE